MAPVISFICIKFFLLFHFHSFLPPPPCVCGGQGQNCDSSNGLAFEKSKNYGEKNTTVDTYQQFTSLKRKNHTDVLVHCSS